MRSKSEIWEQASAHFERLADAAAGEQAAALDRLRQGDPDVAELVASMLESDSAEGLLDASLRQLAPTVVDDVEAGQREQASAPASLPEVPGLRVIQRIGSGGMGEVYLAERGSGEYAQRVALKLLRTGADSPELRRRFLHERRIVAALEHPDIARFIDAGVVGDGRPWFAMEFVSGEPIVHYARRRGLGLRQRVALMTRVCRAVAYAQSQLVVHRDLKPSNILIDEDGRPRLLDFGIAKLMQADAPLAAAETELRAMTPAYAAPEQLLDQPVGTATDVYSLGMVLYELISGRLPREGATTQAEAIASASEDVRKAPSSCLRSASAEVAEVLGLGLSAARRMAREVSGDLDLIVLTALRVDPKRRYAGAAALADDLQYWLDGRPIAARPDSAGYRFRRFVTRHTVGVAAAVLVLLSLVGGLSATLWQAQRADAQAQLARQEAERAERARAFFASLFQDTSPVRQARGVQMTLKEFVEEAAQRLETQLDGLPQEQALIGMGLAFTLKDLGDRGEALRMTERAIERLRALEPASAPLAKALQQRATILNELGRGAEAEAQAQAALAMFQSFDGDTLGDRISARTALLVSARNQGRFGELVAQSEAILRDRETLVGAQNSAVAVDWYNLGVAYAVVDRFADAAAAHRRADELLRADPKAPQSRRAWILAALGNALLLLGQPGAAAVEYEQARRIVEETLGGEHWMMAAALSGLGQCARDLGDHAEAERRLAQADAFSERSEGQIAARTAAELGVLRIEAGSPEQALEPLRRAAAALEKWSPHGPGTARARTSLALAQARSGDVAAALAASNAAIADLDPNAEGERRLVGEIALNHAEVLLRAGESEQARHWRERGEATLESFYPEAHPRRLALLRDRLAPPES